MRVTLILAVFLGLFWVMLRISRDEELRPSRWWRLPASLVPAWICSRFLADVILRDWSIDLGQLIVIVAVVALGFLWRESLAWLASGAFMATIFGDQFRLTGFQPTFRFARIALRDGDWKEALAMTQEELAKSPLNFEGLLLLAEIHIGLDEPAKALVELEKILANPDSTPDQRNTAEAWKSQCLKRQKQLEDGA